MIKHSWNFAPFPLFINPDLASRKRAMAVAVRGRSDSEDQVPLCWVLTCFTERQSARVTTYSNAVGKDVKSARPRVNEREKLTNVYLDEISNMH